MQDQWVQTGNIVYKIDRAHGLHSGGKEESADAANEPVGLKRIADDKWEVRYSFHLLGVLEGKNKMITTVKTWHRGAKV